jgi:hypothetical protein
VPASDTKTSQASRTLTDRYGIKLGQSHPTFDQVKDLAWEYGVVLEKSDNLWTLTGFSRTVSYYAHNRCVRLEESDLGNREGDFAVAIVVVLTGKYPLTNAELRLSRKIRNELYSK